MMFQMLRCYRGYWFDVFDIYFIELFDKVENIVEFFSQCWQCVFFDFDVCQFGDMCGGIFVNGYVKILIKFVMCLVLFGRLCKYVVMVDFDYLVKCYVIEDMLYEMCV